MAQHQCTCKTYIVLYWQVQEKYWVVLHARLQPDTQLLTQNIFLTNIRSIGMAGQVARPRLVAHQGVRRSAPSHPAPPCQTPHYPEAPTGLWPPLHQWYLVHLTPVQTIHNNSYKVIHTITILWGNGLTSSAARPGFTKGGAHHPYTSRQIMLEVITALCPKRHV